MNYIDNKKFFNEMKEYKNLCKKNENVGLEKPQISEYLGKCFIDICEHLLTKPNFRNYSFKDDLISDGVENCLMAIDNFDPEKTNNPFAYFTQIIVYCFLRRIDKEKKQVFLKYKVIENSGILDNLNNLIDEEESIIVKNYLKNFNSFEKYKEYESKNKKKKRKKRAKNKNTCDIKLLEI